MAKKRTISAESLRPRRALKTLHYEMQGDWYRDPWGWPELDWLVSDGKEHLRQRLRSDGIRRVAKVDVPKENFGIRPAIVMDPVDRLIYQCLVDRYSLPLVGDLRPWVYGWRLPPKNPKGGKWSHNSIQDAEFRNTISFSSNLRTAALRTDVSSFFASIDLPSLCEAIGDRCGPGPLVERLFDLMRGWGGVAGRRGLAQRSTASAALANMFLQPLDDVLDGFLRDHNPPRAEISSRFGRRLGDVSLARWMDDVWIFSRQPADLRNLQVRMQAVLNEIGLDLNSAKTELLEGEEVAKAAKRIQHSAIDGELNHETEPGSTQLDELIEQILENPSESTRSSIKFATKRMR
ncbi:MAG TPA: reverse transcriptase domain-containing protein, partial [Iamia sp.]